MALRWLTCANKKNVIVFAFGRLHLRIHFDLGEPVTVNNKKKTLRQESTMDIPRISKISFVFFIKTFFFFFFK